MGILQGSIIGGTTGDTTVGVYIGHVSLALNPKP